MFQTDVPKFRKHLDTLAHTAVGPAHPGTKRTYELLGAKILLIMRPSQSPTTFPGRNVIASAHTTSTLVSSGSGLYH